MKANSRVVSQPFLNKQRVVGAYDYFYFELCERGLYIVNADEQRLTQNSTFNDQMIKNMDMQFQVFQSRTEENYSTPELATWTLAPQSDADSEPNFFISNQ